jgi:hypothetical protein
MGWGNCGTDSKGRPIGYYHEATCDHPGCGAEIHRGLAYVCGGMHGEDEHSCEGYFCTAHLTPTETIEGDVISVCPECLKMLVREGLLAPNELEAYAERGRTITSQKPHQIDLQRR